MITIGKENIRFNYRIAAACLNEGKILLHKSNEEHFWSLPGGRAELLENSRETIAREMMEETGFVVSVRRPLWFSEHFYEFKGKQIHEVGIIYDVVFEDHNVARQEVFYGEEPGGIKLTFQWFEIKKIQDMLVYPGFLKEGLLSIPESVSHVIYYNE